MAWSGFRWRPYVPVARRRAQAQEKMASLRKKGANIQPVVIEGRTIARTFWGQSWCDHLESFSDYENRLPRGRTYVRNGSVCHLEIGAGEILAKVAGSRLYNVRIRIETLPAKKWKAVKQRCAGQVGSLLELLQGKLSSRVMEVVTDPQDGLFPCPKEISLSCSCPDWAVMCKHVAAVLYGVGARLDRQPELLFKLRGVDHEELIDADAEAAVSAATTRGKSKRLSDGDLSGVFGIDLDTSEAAAATGTPRTKRAKKVTAAALGETPAAKKSAKKKSVKKKTPRKKSPQPAGQKTAAKRTTRKVAAKSAISQDVEEMPTALQRKKAGKKAVAGKATRKPRAKSKD